MTPQKYCAENPDRLKLFGHILTAFYNDDLVEDVNIRSWALDARSKHPANSPGDVCRNQGLLLLKAIHEQSSDEDDDDEDEDESEEEDEEGEGEAEEEESG